jgi:hypothetical protein
MQDVALSGLSCEIPILGGLSLKFLDPPSNPNQKKEGREINASLVSLISISVRFRQQFSRDNDSTDLTNSLNQVSNFLVLSKDPGYDEYHTNGQKVLGVQPTEKFDKTSFIAYGKMSIIYMKLGFL